jgi:hypothetical protein
MTDARYSYDRGDYLSIRPNYSYADCSGSDFPALWLARRREAWAMLAAPGGPPVAPPTGIAASADAIGIEALLERLAQPDTDGELDQLVQRFEAGKRLYDVYRGTDRRGDTGSGFREMTRYVRFGEILAAAYPRRRALPLLNALLKLCDLLSAHADDIPATWRGRAAQVLDGERRFVADLAHARGVPWPE